MSWKSKKVYQAGGRRGSWRDSESEELDLPWLRGPHGPHGKREELSYSPHGNGIPSAARNRIRPTA